MKVGSDNQLTRKIPGKDTPAEAVRYCDSCVTLEARCCCRQSVGVVSVVAGLLEPDLSQPENHRTYRREKQTSQIHGG